jgi:lipopolysaccharide/colanic/teichoic acid biosynthesis glycosyltransferase
MGLRAIGFVGPEHAGLDRCSTPWIGSYGDLRAIVGRERVDQVVIALDRSDPEDPLKLLHELYDTAASIRFVPDLLGLTTLRAGVEDLDGLPMVRIIDEPMVGWRRIAKRGIDLGVSLAGLALGLPVFGVIGLGVKLGSSGPVFFGQERVSLDGRPFRMWKFRTMVDKAEDDTGPVLRGEMSLVGPRPERPEFIAQFRQQLPGYMLRHKTKGGITGLAQVSGLRGRTSVERRLELDIEYLEHWSLTLDLKILALTLLRVFRDPNAY